MVRIVHQVVAGAVNDPGTPGDRPSAKCRPITRQLSTQRHRSVLTCTYTRRGPTVETSSGEMLPMTKRHILCFCWDAVYYPLPHGHNWRVANEMHYQMR
jgi:hypothetical protein